MKLSPKDKVDIIKAFTEDLTPMIAIANRYGVCRQTIYKMVRRAGVQTSKGLGNTIMPVTCSACGSEIIRTRARIRNQVNHFCNDACYFAYLDAGNGHGAYIENRQGQRIARGKIAELFDLQPGNIVHHKDRNCLNNMVDNLMVFANQGDHIRYHRLGPDYIKPIWG